MNAETEIRRLDHTARAREAITRQWYIEHGLGVVPVSHPASFPAAWSVFARTREEVWERTWDEMKKLMENGQAFVFLKDRSKYYIYKGWSVGWVAYDVATGHHDGRDREERQF